MISACILSFILLLQYASVYYSYNDKSTIPLYNVIILTMIAIITNKDTEKGEYTCYTC